MHRSDWFGQEKNNFIGFFYYHTKETSDTVATIKHFKSFKVVFSTPGRNSNPYL